MKQMRVSAFLSSSYSFPLALFLLFVALSTSPAAADEVEQPVRREKQPENRPDVAICEGSTSAFFVSDNMNIRGANASAQVRGVNEKQCMELCAHNQDHKGRAVLCASAVYDAEAQECQLFRRASAPDGQLERKPEEGRRFFEKFCLPEEAPADCANRQFVRVDDFILKGYAQSTTTVPTMAECAAYCMREREFECRSAMYFHEEGECITNVESAITAPDDFQRPDDGDKVVFFHNGCLLPGAGSSPAQDGQFELAQSQDPTTAVSSPLLAHEEEKLAITEATSIAAQSSSSPASSSSSAPPSIVAEQQRPSSPELQQPQESSSPASTAGHSSIGSDSTETVTTPISSSSAPDRADVLPVVGEAKTNPREEEEEEEGGQKLEESSPTGGAQPLAQAEDFGPNREEENGGGPAKAVPVPTAEAAQTADPIAAKSAMQFHPKQLATPQLDKASANAAGEQQQQPQQRQYGAKTIERASDGSFQEKKTSEANAAAGGLPVPSSSTATAPNSNSPTTTAAAGQSKPTPAPSPSSSHKGPESTKRLQLKLIKDQQQPKPDINSLLALAPPPPPPPPFLKSLVPVPPATEESSSVEQAQPSSADGNSSADEGKQQQQQVVQQQQEQSAEEHFEGSEGYFSRWGPWTPCHVPGERRVRRRKCLDLRRCKGALMQVDYCPRDIPAPSEEADALPQDEQQQQQSQQQTSGQSQQNQQQSEVAPAAPIPEVPPSPSRQPVPIDLSGAAAGESAPLQQPIEAQPPAIMPPSQEGEQQQKSIPAGAPAPRPADDAAIWSPWNGTCQHFASSQPCKDGQVIGFESRECIAKDPLACKGPFFRYCTLPC